jgi:CHC2-type zinc finger protein
MYSPALLDQIRAAVPVSTVVGRRVRLKKTGREWKGLSPFSNERTPSFFVNDHKMFWHDFSSGKHGDVFGFVMEMEGIAFREAVEQVAAIAGMAGELEDAPPPKSVVPPPRREPDAAEIREKADRLVLARQLWRRSLPAEGTIAAIYLRGRGYRGRIPATLRYLPRSGAHAPALIAAFGLAHEIEAADHARRWEAERGKPLPVPSPDDPKAVPWEPGPWLPDSSPDSTLHIADADVMGVHLTKLRPDGSDRLRGDKAKITIGTGFVAPIVLAASNDLMALTIGEGIEKVLADHEVSGAGAWAAASAVRLPGLADLVPRFIECVTVLVDDNEIGRTKAAELAAALDARGFEVRLTPTGEPP